MVFLKEVKSNRDYQIAAKLFREYASHIGIDLEFQGFAKEIETLDSHYVRPQGTIFIACDNNDFPLGCFGVRPLSSSICELKRMYLKEEARGKGIGSLLLSKSILVAKELGYRKMRLDTLPTMHSAIAIYRKIGFYEIESYRYNPVPGTKYLEIDLDEHHRHLVQHPKL